MPYKRPRPGALERFIAWVSPSWAAKRAAWRDVAKFGYRGGQPGRLDSTGSGVNGAADYHLEQAYDRREMVDRGRELDRDNVIAHGALDRVADNVVGCGATPQAASEDEAWNAEVEKRFADWCQAEADVRRLCTFAELQHLWVRSRNRDGDVGAILLDDGSLQMVESDQLVAPIGTEYHPRMVDGIETDKRGRPLRFHVLDNTDWDKITGNRRYMPGRVAVPADSFLFDARRARLGQTRGDPVFGQNAWLLDQIDQQIEAVTAAAKMAACFGLVLETENDYALMAKREKDRRGRPRRTWDLAPGSVKRLEPGEKLSQVKPEHPTTNFEGFIVLLGRVMGLGLGLPLELLFLDFSRTNYSSARASLLQAQDGFRLQQAALRDHFLAPVWRWKVLRWLADGTLKKPSDSRGLAGALSHTWIMPGWKWLDPVKEIEAHLLAVDAGWETVTGVAASLGRDFSELLETRKRELQKMEAAGVPLVRSNLSRDPLVPGKDAA